MISFFLHTWLPVVIASAPASSISMARAGVMPSPPAIFSPLITLKSARLSCKYLAAACLPGFPITSPRNRTVISSSGIFYRSCLSYHHDLDLAGV